MNAVLQLARDTSRPTDRIPTFRSSGDTPRTSQAAAHKYSEAEVAKGVERRKEAERKRLRDRETERPRLPRSRGFELASVHAVYHVARRLVWIAEVHETALGAVGDAEPIDDAAVTSLNHRGVASIRADIDDG